MAQHTLTIREKIEASSLGGAGSTAGGLARKSMQDARQLQQQMRVISEFTKLASALAVTTRAVGMLKNVLDYVVKDTPQNAGLKTGLNFATNMADSGLQGAAAGARMGGLIGGAVGLALGAFSGYSKTAQSIEQKEKEDRERRAKQEKEDRKKRAGYLFEGELIDFQRLNSSEQLNTLKSWSRDVEKARRDEAAARKELSEGGDVRRYEYFKNVLDQSQNRLEAAASFYDASRRKSHRETVVENFLDSMSQMGLYMNGSFATGGGRMEIEIEKEQRDILKQIESNTRNNANDDATYS